MMEDAKSYSGIVGQFEGDADLGALWAIAEASAAEHGQEVRREDWRLVMPVHLVETRHEALDDACLGAGHDQREYFERTMGPAAVVEVPAEKVIEGMVDRGAWIVGTPDTRLS